MIKPKKYNYKKSEEDSFIALFSWITVCIKVTACVLDLLFGYIAVTSCSSNIGWYFSRESFFRMLDSSSKEKIRKGQGDGVKGGRCFS
jgi:hypothetical protein